MNVTFLGGAGEYGRSCFLLETQKKQFLIDCGIHKSETDPELRIPRLQLIDSSRLAAVFITHSHDDHTGALKQLADTGWSGPLYASAPTFAQMEDFPNAVEMRPLKVEQAGSWLQAADETEFCFGRAGHTEGACWYLFRTGSETVFFSGDYTFHSGLYPYDMPPEGPVDLAVMDGAYGWETRTQKEAEKQLLYRMKGLAGKGLIHGPLVGKSQEIFLLLAEAGFAPTLDPAMQEYTLESLQERRRWFKQEGAEKLGRWLDQAQGTDDGEEYGSSIGVYLEKTLMKAELPKEAVTIFTTGPKLPALEEYQYEHVPFFVHPTIEETKQLLQVVQPARTVFTHTPDPEVFAALEGTNVITALVGDIVDTGTGRVRRG